MHNVDHQFHIETGTVAIGDPAMGLAEFALRLPPGDYRLAVGALCESSEPEKAAIRLDGPYLFVVDAASKGRFEECFHELFEECGYAIPDLVERLDELSSRVGRKVGFYWEGELTGVYIEGSYDLDPACIEPCR